MLDPASAAELDEARRLNERMVLRALAMGGTCSGEHGVGDRQDEVSRSGAWRRRCDVMRTIKRALDPENRMNPGKMIDSDAADRSLDNPVLLPTILYMPVLPGVFRGAAGP